MKAYIPAVSLLDPSTMSAKKTVASSKAAEPAGEVTPKALLVHMQTLNEAQQKAILAAVETMVDERMKITEQLLLEKQCILMRNITSELEKLRVAASSSGSKSRARAQPKESKVPSSGIPMLKKMLQDTDYVPGFWDAICECEAFKETNAYKNYLKVAKEKESDEEAVKKARGDLATKLFNMMATGINVTLNDEEILMKRTYVMNVIAEKQKEEAEAGADGAGESAEGANDVADAADDVEEEEAPAPPKKKSAAAAAKPAAGKKPATATKPAAKTTTATKPAAKATAATGKKPAAKK